MPRAINHLVDPVQVFEGFLRHPFEQFPAAWDVPDESDGLSHHQGGVIHIARLPRLLDALAGHQGDEFLQTAAALFDGRDLVEHLALESPPWRPMDLQKSIVSNSWRRMISCLMLS